VVYSGADKSATAWNRTLDGETLEFEVTDVTDENGDMLIRDTSTGSLWSWLSGTAVDGEHKGAKLQQLSYHPIRIDRFRAFYPYSSTFK